MTSKRPVWLTDDQIEEFGLELSDKSIVEILTKVCPDVVTKCSDIGIEYNGEVEKVDLSQAIDLIVDLDKSPLEVIAVLLKLKHGTTNLAYTYEQYYNQEENDFRVWRSKLESKLNSKDEEINPLLPDSKNTNSAIDAYVRKQPEYKEYKEKLNDIKNVKNSLWSARKMINDAVTICKLYIADPESVRDAIDSIDDKQINQVIGQMAITEDHGFNRRN